MSPEAQRIAIAEACGWKYDERNYLWRHPSFALGAQLPPDHLTDLNAMHEAEKVLTHRQQEEYWAKLLPVIDPECLTNRTTDINWFLVSATAAQRAEAFLRTIGKWDDSK